MLKQFSSPPALTGFSLDNGLAGVIDIGTSKISCFIARNGLGSVDGPDMDVIGVGHQASIGVGTGNLVELAAESAIRGAVDKAERMAGERLEKYWVAIGARHIACRRLAVDLDLDGMAVAQEDIDACYREGLKLAAADGTVPLHVWPSRFTIDGMGGVTDPRGIACRRLSVEMVSLAASETAVRAVRSCFERCNLKPAGFIAAPYAAALAVLQEEERDLGVLCLDMGARLTGFSLFRHGALVIAGAVPVGSEHITRDLSHGLDISLEDAERLKAVHGTCWCMPGDEGRLVEKPGTGNGAGGEPSYVPVTDIAEIIGPRLEEILLLVKDRIASAGIDPGTSRRAVLTGGGSQLQGAGDLVEKVLGMKTRIGRPINDHGAPAAANGHAFAVCAGMIEHLAMTAPGAGRNRGRGALITGHLLSPEEALAEPGEMPAGLFGRAAHWLRVHF